MTFLAPSIPVIIAGIGITPRTAIRVRADLRF
jgi:hypothetical protein